MKKDKTLIYLLGIVFILFIWQIMLVIDLPAASHDGPYFISKTFAVLRGDFFQNSFAYNYMQPDLSPYMYGLITAPFYAIFTDHTYSIFIFNFLVLIGITVALLYYFSIKPGIPVWVQGLSIIIFWVSPNSYNLRPEVFNILLIIINIIFLHKYSTTKKLIFIILSAVMTSIIGIVHPVAGVFTVLATSIYFLDQSIPFSRYITWGITVVAILCIIYLPIILIDFDHWRYYFFEKNIVDDDHTFNPTLILKYIIYNPLLFALFISVIPFWSKKSLLKELGYLLIIILVLSLFGRSYYFPYLAIFMIWRISQLSIYKFKIPALLIAVLIASPFLSHYLPTIQQLENREYSNRYRDVLVKVKEYGSIAEENKVWVSSDICMPVIEKEGSRLHYNFYYLMDPSLIRLEEGDRVLISNNHGFEYIYKNLKHSPEELEITSVVPATSQGLLTSTSLFRKRNNPVGLWEIKLKNKEIISETDPLESEVEK